eukprot:3517789-Rhodomonas_salina.2
MGDEDGAAGGRDQQAEGGRDKEAGGEDNLELSLECLRALPLSPFPLRSVDGGPWRGAVLKGVCVYEG